MSKFHPLVLAVAFLLVFYGQKASAEASGPDYFQLKADKAVNLYEESDLNAKVIGIIPANTTGLKNLGCTGFVTFEKWRKMRAEEQTIAKEKVWCKISYNDQMGWIQNIYLGEDGLPSSPTFDCKKAKGEIEALICNNPELINLDHQLADTYQQALAKASSLDTQPDKAVKNLKTLQRGWIKGRNECWKELEEKKSCVQSQYARRIAYLQTQWVLVPPSKTIRFECENKGEEFFAAFFVTQTIPSVAVEYGDRREIFVSSPAASGAKYTGDFGRSLWIKGDQATLVWDPAQPEKSCHTH
jgi:uncharacterized protein